jgi:hypothetical protein
MAFLLATYISVAVYSVSYSYRRLHRPGVSQEVREMFFRKHFVYVVVFIVLWSVQQSQNYMVLFNPPPNDTITLPTSEGHSNFM